MTKLFTVNEAMKKPEIIKSRQVIFECSFETYLMLQYSFHKLGLDGYIETEHDGNDVYIRIYKED